LWVSACGDSVGGSGGQTNEQKNLNPPEQEGTTVWGKDTQMDRQMKRQMDRHADGKTARRKALGAGGTETDRETDRQMDRQTGIAQQTEEWTARLMEGRING
jgi:hypothetical protein